jgi:hypothetical protein
LREVLTETRLRIRHTKVKATAEFAEMVRHNVEIRVLTFAVPLAEAFYTLDYFVIQRLPESTDIVETDALADWQIASSNANLVKLLNWES